MSGGGGALAPTFSREPEKRLDSGGGGALVPTRDLEATGSRERAGGRCNSPEKGWRRAVGASLLLGALVLSPAVVAGARGDDGATERMHDNAALVRAAFDSWRAGTGSVFDLLADDVQWRVAGSSPVSGVYRSKRDFLERAVAPITARLATPIVPEVQHVIAQGDTVVVIWRGTARARDGSTYSNHYAWHMQLDDGRIVRVVAFLDTWTLGAFME